MSSETLISGHHLSKVYRLYDRPADRLKQILLPRVSVLGRLLGLPDPSTLHREFSALQDISLEVRRGETLGIIGENGSGKSTLLQIICGTLNPTTGERFLKGRVAALLELGAGFNPEFTGRENIYLNAALYGLSRSDVDARLQRIIDFAEIGFHIDQPVRTYSSGMFVRLAFSVVANIDADVLVIDEALAVGDARFQQKCMRFLRKFQERGAILFVSHDTGAMMSFCSRVIWLKNGALMAEGDPRTVCEDYLGYLYQKTNDSPYQAAVTPTTESEPMEDQPATSVEGATFNVDSGSFGDGRAEIVWAEIRKDGAVVHTLSGGETIDLIVSFRAQLKLEGVIVGFIVKDRLGQYIFGDNTFATTKDNPRAMEAQQNGRASFRFTLPSLSTGDYAVTIAVASGTLEDHVQHHWMHDGLVFKVHNSRATGVLLGIPMENIELSINSRVGNVAATAS